MEILHAVGPFDQGENVTVSLKDTWNEIVSASEIIFSLGSTDYHRSLSWL